MRAIQPLNPFKIVSTCLEGPRPSSEDDGAGCKALCAALGGNFCRHLLWSAMVVIVFVDQ
jgi:hypothetical protein